MEKENRNDVDNDEFYSYAPEGEQKESKKSFLGTKETGPVSVIFGCCECSVVGFRILMIVFLVVVSCILHIICATIDIINDGKDTEAFLFWFFVMITLFFCCDTVLIFFLCVKGLPCIPSNTVISYTLLPFYLIVQAVFVSFMFLQLLVNGAEWTVQRFPRWKGIVPLELDIVHIVVNALGLVVFSCCLCFVFVGFLITAGILVSRKFIVPYLWKTLNEIESPDLSLESGENKMKIGDEEEDEIDEEKDSKGAVDLEFEEIKIDEIEDEKQGNSDEKNEIQEVPKDVEKVDDPSESFKKAPKKIRDKTHVEISSEEEEDMEESDGEI